MIRQNPNSTSLAIQDSNDRTIRVDQAARDFAIEWREVASLGLFCIQGVFAAYQGTHSLPPTSISCLSRVIILKVVY
ncbi:hypothetical protein V6N13_029688 [Hibiscus sabdariffa]